MIMLMFLLAFVLLALLVWLLFDPRSRNSRTAMSPLQIKELLPLHCRHFPQVRHVLGGEDEKFLARRLSRKTIKEWRRERNRVLWLYVQGLAEDFGHLQQLARLIASLSPEVRPAQEWELLVLGLKFQALHRLTLVRLATRALPLGEMARLTELVANLGFELEHFLDRMAEGVPQARMSSAN